MDTFIGIQTSELLKVKEVMDRYDISIDEMLNCFDMSKYKRVKISRLKRHIEAKNKEILELEKCEEAEFTEWEEESNG